MRWWSAGRAVRRFVPAAPPHSLRAGLAAVAATLAAFSLLLAAPVTRAEPQPSEMCGLCHRDIYTMWRSSAHARSMESLVFQEALQGAKADHGAGVAQLCLNCHSPMLQAVQDPKLRQKVTWEGVSCDFCHSLVSVDPAKGLPKQVIDVGDVKRGPIRGTVSTGHEVAYSDLHTKSLVCAGCHEYQNPEGVRVLATYSEWKDSGAAKEGKQCQDCHMDRTAANVVDPRVKRVSSASVNVHEVPGGHSLEFLHKAVAASIEPVREGDTLTLTLRLTNKGAGHAVPTGMPGRRVILNVEVKTSSGASFKEERVYGRFFADAAGDAVVRDSGYFASGVKETSDSRLKADERRVETFRFQVPPDDTAFVRYQLHYEHSPLGGPEGRTRLTFLTEQRTIAPRQP